jgi:hypothetical protein
MSRITRRRTKRTLLSWITPLLVRTFFTTSRACLWHARAGPSTGNGAGVPELAGCEMRELGRAGPPGLWRRGKAGHCSRAGRRLRPRPLACGRCRARRPTPGAVPRYRQAVVTRRHAAPDTTPCVKPWLARPPCRASSRRSRSQSRALPTVASPTAHKPRRP